MTTKRPVKKIEKLLQLHEVEIVRELGPTAFDLLTPQEVASELDINAKIIPDLLRQGWLEPVPGKSIGSAYQYYRWRVQFVKRFRQSRPKQKEIPV